MILRPGMIFSYLDGDSYLRIVEIRGTDIFYIVNATIEDAKKILK